MTNGRADIKTDDGRTDRQGQILTSPDYCHWGLKNSRKYLKGYQSYLADMISIAKFTKNTCTSMKNGSNVAVLFLCTLSDGSSYFN